jgi:hypothetical protein
MSQLTNVNRSPLLAAATAITAVGFLTAAPLAHARPILPLAPGACSQYLFNGNFSLKQSNGDTVVFSSIGPAASGNATATGGINGPLHGVVTGGIQGDKLDFQIVWNVNAPGTTATSHGDYTGYVSADGFAHGGTAEQIVAFGDDTPPAQASWDSTVPLVCSTPAAPAAAAAPPPPPPLIGGLPADTVVTPFSGARSVPPLNAAPPAPVAPHDAVTVSFGNFSPFSGLPVTATNSAAIAGTCTYDSTPGNYHHDFNLAPNGKTTFNITGLPTGTTYHVVVSCTGTFNGQTVEFGHVETDKSF